MMITLPKHPKARAAQQVIERLRGAGSLAYLAGGSVRDILLGKTPKDYDVVTSATPEEVEKIFTRTIPIGKAFGIIMVLFAGHRFEIATFRTEGAYSDKRRPDEVFWATAKEDALRRDFTINALFLDQKNGRVIDYVNGRRDLRAGIIRFVGEPDKRLQEDHLRVLRAVRFKNGLNFQYDPATYAALTRSAKLVTDISPERVRQEFDLIFLAPNRAQSLRELDSLGMLSELLPEVTQLHGIPQPREFHHEGDVFEHSLLAVESLPRRAPSFLVWATLLHDVGKAKTLHYPDRSDDRIRFNGHGMIGAEIAQDICHRLKMSRTETETISWLVEHHMNIKGIDEMREYKRREYLLDPRFRWLLELHKADASGTKPRDLALYRETRNVYSRYLQLWRTEQKLGRPQPLVTGDDLLALGLKPGKEIGRILGRVHRAQLEQKITSREEALLLAKSLITH